MHEHQAGAIGNGGVKGQFFMKAWVVFLCVFGCFALVNDICLILSHAYEPLGLVKRMILALSSTAFLLWMDWRDSKKNN